VVFNLMFMTPDQGALTQVQCTYHTIPYHTIPYHTIPYTALHTDSSLVLPDTRSYLHGFYDSLYRVVHVHVCVCVCVCVTSCTWLHPLTWQELRASSSNLWEWRLPPPHSPRMSPYSVSYGKFQRNSLPVSWLAKD
jgi:hypothetical protein